VDDMTGSVVIKLAKETFKEFSIDRASRHGAALAYYAIFSIAPLFIIAVAVCAFFLGEAASQGHLAKVLHEIVGPKTAQTIQEIVKNAARPGAGIVATVLGFIVLAYGATNIFVQLKDSLNAIWNLPHKPATTWLGFFLSYIFAFLVVIIVGVLLLASAAITATITYIGTWFSDWLPGGTLVWSMLNHLTSFVLILVVFSLLYKFVPDAKVGWAPVWAGGALASFLFVIGKWALGLYLARSTVTSAYGAAGSLVVLLIWIYYSAQIFFLGAEFAQVYAEYTGCKITPKFKPAKSK